MRFAWRGTSTSTLFSSPTSQLRLLFCLRNRGDMCIDADLFYSFFPVFCLCIPPLTSTWLDGRLSTLTFTFNSRMSTSSRTTQRNTLRNREKLLLVAYRHTSWTSSLLRGMCDGLAILAIPYLPDDVDACHDPRLGPLSILRPLGSPTFYSMNRSSDAAFLHRLPLFGLLSSLGDALPWPVPSLGYQSFLGTWFLAYSSTDLTNIHSTGLSS
jgi:hypothetical protein